MGSKQKVRDTIARLERAIASGNMPPAANDLAERIAKRLKNPVRLAIMGNKNAGKSQLVNFLAAEEVIPKGADLPSVMVTWGKTEKFDCTLANGNVKTLESFDVDEITRLNPVFVRLILPLPALKGISVLEVVAGEKHAEQQRALAWAARSTDIALWCTQTYSDAESDLWNTLPSNLKDHSFMIMTKADKFRDKSAMERQLGNLKVSAMEQFHSVHHIDALLALAACRKDGSVNDMILTKSGGKDLRRAIMQAVDRGIQASLDGSVILFARYEIPEPAIEAPELPAAGQNSNDAPLDEPTELLVSNDAPAPQGAKDDFNSEIVTYLTGRVKELQDQLSKSETPDSELVMAQCFEDVEWLVEQLSEKARDNPDFLHTLDACQDAADMMLLLQLENHDSAVEDAVVLLLQIKRDFEQKIAA